jgi:hypothetical protein
VPKGAYYDTEKNAVKIVRNEQVGRGWTPGAQVGQREQPREGCDFLSTPPEGGPAHPVEVKGWGDPILDKDGSFTYPADINIEQLERARRDPNWRLEIVGNLASVRDGRGRPQRLTLTAEDVLARAKGWRFKVRLTGLEKRVTSR